MIPSRKNKSSVASFATDRLKLTALKAVPFTEESNMLRGGTKKKKVEKTEEDEEMDIMWAEMQVALDKEAAAVNGTSSASQNCAKEKVVEEGKCSICGHWLELNEEIGLICNTCGRVVTEIKDIFPPFAPNYDDYGKKRKKKRARKN